MKKVLLALLFVSMYSASYADNNKPLDPKSNLDSLSKAYFVVGDNTCLLIDAVKDGLIDPSKPYDISFGRENMVINGTIMSKAVAARYYEKVKQLHLMDGTASVSTINNQDTSSSSMIGDCVCDLNKPLHPMPKSVRDYLNADRKMSYSLMIDKLLAAHLIASRSGITISSSDSAIYVNDKKLSADQEKLVAPYLQRMQFMDDVDQSFATGKMTHSDPAHTNSLITIH